MKKIAIANPEGVVTAKAGEEILASDNSVWVKISNNGNTGWVMLLDSNQMAANSLPANINTASPYTFVIDAADNAEGYDITSIPNSWKSSQNIKGVAFGNKVTSIGNNAFFGNQLTRVTIPKSITSIGNYAFQNNPNLNAINCYASRPVINNAINIFQNTSPSLVIRVRASDNTWTAGSGQNIGGNPSVTVIKNL
jgi:hypothetical protein